jgi:putative transcriptional regulator
MRPTPLIATVHRQAQFYKLLPLRGEKCSENCLQLVSTRVGCSWKQNVSGGATEMALPNRVRQYRLARGETVRDVAAAIGVSHAMISRLERGDIGCSDKYKVALAQHFNVAVMDLFFIQSGNNELPETQAVPA